MNALAPRIAHDASDIVGLVERARGLLDKGDLAAARLVAEKAMGDAKTNNQLARKFAAGSRLMDKANQLQGDALLMLARVQIAMADDVDAGQEAGTIAKKGGDPNVRSADIATLDDLGVDRRRLAEFRSLRDQERAEPGIAARAINAMVERGLAPTKSSLRHAIGTRSATKEERADDFYQTPIEAMQALLALEAFTPKVVEPSCGLGAIVRPLDDAGYDTVLADLIDRGCANAHGEVQAVGNFLESQAGAFGEGPLSIVTNPPYGSDVMNPFIAHALKVHRPRKMALLMNLNVLCGHANADRNFWIEEWPPARVYVFKRRLPMMHRDGWEGPEAGSQMNTAWFVWEDSSVGQMSCETPLATRAYLTDRPYGATTELIRVDWKDFEGVEPLKPLGAAQ